jgi:hypothetical protein
MEKPRNNITALEPYATPMMNLLVAMSPLMDHDTMEAICAW